MTSHAKPPRQNYLRRLVGLVICLSPVGLLVVSLVAGLEPVEESSSVWVRVVRIAVVCLPLSILNFYLALIRPRLYAERVGYRNISGIPLFGTLLVLVFCGWLAFGDWRVAVVGLVALALDTGGLPWFLIATWRDQSLWDA
jgi:hypothetical protein